MHVQYSRNRSKEGAGVVPDQGRVLARMESTMRLCLLAQNLD